MSGTREKPVIVTAAITGSVASSTENPNLPITPAEIADAAVEAAEAGAAIVHIHVREADGTPSAHAELYEEVFDSIRSRSGVLICATTGSGAGRFSEEERLAALSLAPDIASLDAGSMNFGERVFQNPPELLRRLARDMGARGILPELECFDVGMVSNALRLAEEGLLPVTGRWWFQFCLGVRGGAPARAGVILAMRDLLPHGAEWSVLGVGRAQLPVALIAMAEGGHVRTGLEDNAYFRKGEHARSNAQLVRRIAGIAGDLGRGIASVPEARELLGIAPRAVAA